MTRLLYALGRFCVRHRWLVVAVWLVPLVGVGLLAHAAGSRTNDNYTLPGTGAQQAADLLKRLFPEQKNGSSPIVFHTATGKLTDGAHEQAVEDAFRAVKDSPLVQDVVDPLGKAGEVIGLVSDDETTAYMPVILNRRPGDVTEADAWSVIDAARKPAERANIEVAAGGILGALASRGDTSEGDIYGLAAAGIILLLVFGSVAAMGLPILTALFGLSIGMACITLLSHAIDMPFEAPILATMIGLGVGIDYALFTVTRHRDQMREGMDVKESIARATATSGGAIVFAGGTVMIAIASLGLTGIPIVVTCGYTTSIVIAIAVLAAITLAPSVLSIIGRHLESLRMPRFLRPRDKDPRTGVWARWADWVGRHPWTSVGMALLVLVPLMLPMFELELGSPDVSSDPKDTTQRQAYDLMSRGFGPGYNGPLLIAVELDSPAEPSPRFVAERQRAKEIGAHLERMQAQGERMKARLEAEGERLKSEGLALAARFATLQAEQARLKAKGARLLRRKAVLQRKGARLESRGQALGARLTRILTKEQIVAQEIASTTDPAELAELQARMQRLQARQAAVEERLALIQRLGARLKAQGEKLAKQGARLKAQGARLAARAEPLLAEKTRLEHAKAKLERKARRAKIRGRAMKRRAEAKIDLLKDLKRSLVRQMEDAAGKEAATDPRLTALRTALESTPGVVDVSPVQLSSSRRAALITAVPSTAPSARQTSELVARIRGQVIPRATDGNGVTAYVGGMTAAYDDLADVMADKLPRVIAMVIGCSFLVLLLAFRSVAIPIKAAVMNVLSVTAAYGVLTAVFQWGWGLHLIGIQADHVPIVSFVPLVMFAVLFGLSMDYEVFLMSRIIEHHAVGDSDHDAVVAGLSLSARVISAAALIMVAVFAAFILNPNPIIKQFGVGLSVAVALDATVVRILLVPAVMALLGRVNWWIPRWLDRILPRLELEGKGYFERRREAEAAR